MKDQVYEEKRHLFREEVEHGKRLNYGDLRNLDKNFSDDYMTIILKQDNAINEYAHEAMQKADL